MEKDLRKNGLWKTENIFFILFIHYLNAQNWIAQIKLICDYLSSFDMFGFTFEKLLCK